MNSDWRAGFVQLLSLRMSVVRDSRRCEMADKTESSRSSFGKFVCRRVLCPLAREFNRLIISRTTLLKLISGLDTENTCLCYECKDVYTAMFIINTK